jgi:hypothetical protein
MGVLRIKEDVDKMAELDEIIRRDPYELFTLDEPHRIARRMRPEFWGAAVVGVVIAFFIAFATLWSSQKDGVGTVEPYAYFEVKVIDPEGRPVAGAVVREGDKSLGVTDSFGEWRRFMRVDLGGTVSLTVAKKIGAVSLTAVKNLAVPGALPGGGDLEIAGTVQLLRTPIKGTPVTPAPATSAATAAVAPVSMPASVPVGASAAGFLSVWIMADQASPRLEAVVASLRRRARELGLKIDPQSQFRLALTELPMRGAGALIQVHGSVAADGQRQALFSFLRNYQDKATGTAASGDAMPTARDILWATLQHARVPYVAQRDSEGWAIVPPVAALWAQAPGRTVEDAAGRLHRLTAGALGEARLPPGACDAAAASCTVWSPGLARVSPVAAWQRLPLKVFGPITAGTDVYVSGYPIDIQGDQATYWGEPSASANLTVVKNGRIALRKKIQAGPNVPFVSLPSAPISRR